MTPTQAANTLSAAGFRYPEVARRRQGWQVGGEYVRPVGYSVVESATWDELDWAVWDAIQRTKGRTG
jgi:hypothetical protein